MNYTLKGHKSSFGDEQDALIYPDREYVTDLLINNKFMVLTGEEVLDNRYPLESYSFLIINLAEDENRRLT